MAVFEQFPYSNFHDLNLDWILKEIQSFAGRLDGYEGDLAHMQEQLDAFPAEFTEEFTQVIYRILDEEWGDLLPHVTEDDDGKVMAVVNGEWDKASIPNGNLPPTSTLDERKVLRVDSSGGWAAEHLVDITGDYRIFDEYETYLGSVSTSTPNTWTNTTNANYKHKAIPVKPGQHIVLYASALRATVYAVLKSHTLPLSGTVDFTADATLTGRKSLTVGTSVGFDIPADAHYLYIQNVTGGNDATPQLLRIDGYNIVKSSLAAGLITYTDEKNADLFSEKVDNWEIPAPYPNSGYLTTTGGTSSGNGKYTDYIPIPSTVDRIAYKLTSIGSASILYFYDVNKQGISGIIGTAPNHHYEQGVVNVPAGAKYLRAGQWNEPGQEDYYVRLVYSGKTLSDMTENLTASVNVLTMKESINKPFDFENKKITVFGDSIAQGITSPNLQVGTSFMSYFATHVGATVENQAVSGQKFASNTQYSIYTKVLAYTGTTDFIVIAGGTNDYNTSSALGGVNSATDSDTMYGALKAICNYLQTNYSSTPVIFITPIPYTDIPEGAVNSLGYTLNDYRKAIYEIATYYGHSVVDGASLGMPNTSGGWNNLMVDDSDGCHPTQAGHKLMARSLAGKLL